MTLKPITEILDLNSADYWGKDVETAIGQYVSIDTAFYQRLKKKMGCDGKSTVPIYARNGDLYNGHHRTKIATELGWLFLETDDKLDFRNELQEVF
jgi:hypothetical protein